MSDNRDEIIKYRLAKAFEALEDAERLAEDGSWTGVTNRLYYACFYGVSALLLKQGLYAKTHTGVKNLFHQEFIKTKTIDPVWGRFYQDLFDLRNEGDYSDMVYLSESETKPLLPKAEDFLKEIRTFLDSK